MTTWPEGCVDIRYSYTIDQKGEEWDNEERDIIEESRKRRDY